MKLNRNLKIVIMLLGFSLLSSCVSTGDGSISLSKSTKKLIDNATFEVVVKIPAEDNITYEKELPLDQLSYNLRNDEYYSIGTAFAISETELLSAFHVIPLDSYSLNYKNYYIRDNEDNVYELDNITGFNRTRDYIKFTVKDKVFDDYFTINEDYVINDTVFSVGNAYGEGVIIRDGSLIGELEEPENGAWLNLKSSSDVNSGNSGGPLLNKKGEVIAIVTSKKDNIAYSLPIKEVYNDLNNKGLCHYKFRYGFNLFPEMIENHNFDITVDLPKKYHDVIEEVHVAYDANYLSKMDELFSTYEDEIFPRGESSLEALYDNTYNFMPQVVFKDKTSLKWVISGLETKSEILHNNGYLYYSGFLDNSLVANIEKPDEISLKELNENSKLYMDLVLEGINLSREVAGQEIRIKSYGEPFSEEYLTDSYNRKWKISKWNINYSDEVLISFSMPSPKGTFSIIVSGNSADLYSIEYDFKKVMDFIELSYYGTYDEWQEFLALEDIIPEAFKSVELYKDNNDIIFNSSVLKIEGSKNVIDNMDEMQLTLDYDFFKRNNEIKWDIRRVVVSEKIRKNFFVLYNNQKPYKGLRKAYTEDWNGFMAQSHPFNGISFTEEGLTKIAKLLNFNKDNPTADEYYSIYVAREVGESDNIESILDKVKVTLYE